MSNSHHSMSLTDLISLEELKAKIPDIGIALRVLLPDGTSLVLEGQAAPLDDFINNTPLGRETASLCDARLLEEAKCHSEMFEYGCHTGLVKYAAPIFSGRHWLGVIVSGGLRPPEFDERVEELAMQFYLRPEAIRQVAMQVPSVSRRYRKNLVRLVHAFLSQLVEKEEQLRIKAAHTEARIESWKEVSAQAAHRVGNRIDSVGNFLEALRIRLSKQRGAEDIVNDLLPRIKAGVEDARQFLREFRLFATSRPLRVRDANLNDLVRAAVRESASPKSMKLDLDDEMPMLWCDADEVKHCFAELIQNAREAGATRLEIATRYLPELGSVQAVVRDNGSGIPAGKEQEVFEPFFTTKKRGTGFGLPIVKTVIERHKGTIRVEGNHETGACFVLCMPVLKREELEYGGENSAR